jgi:hypothetical protein
MNATCEKIERFLNENKETKIDQHKEIKVDYHPVKGHHVISLTKRNGQMLHVIDTNDLKKLHKVIGDHLDHIQYMDSLKKKKII